MQYKIIIRIVGFVNSIVGAVRAGQVKPFLRHILYPDNNGDCNQIGEWLPKLRIMVCRRCDGITWR